MQCFEIFIVEAVDFSCLKINLDGVITVYYIKFEVCALYDLLEDSIFLDGIVNFVINVYGIEIDANVTFMMVITIDFQLH